MGGDRRAAAAARCAEGAARRHAARGGHRASSRTRAIKIRVSSARGCGAAGTRSPRLGSRQKRWRFRRGACGARARRSMPRRKSFLAANSEIERSGLRADRSRGARNGAAGDRAQRAVAVDRRGGRRRDAVAARQARRICLPPCCGASRQGAYARPLPHRALSGRLGIFREMRGKGLPETGFCLGERTAVGQPVQDRARGRCARADLGAGARRIRLAELRDRSALAASLPRLAGRTLPVVLARGGVLGTSGAWAAGLRVRRVSHRLPGAFCQPRPMRRNGEPLKPLRKHAPLCGSLNLAKTMHVPMLPRLSFTLAP